MYNERPVRVNNKEVYRLFEESKLFPEPPAQSFLWIRPVSYVSSICSENFEFLDEIKRQIAKLQSSKHLIGEWEDTVMFFLAKFARFLRHQMLHGLKHPRSGPGPGSI
jgi:hypothetical protein